jgi:hypothetical protein
VPGPTTNGDDVDDSDKYWWCTVHDRVEDSSTTCRLADRYGPYESEEAARNWRQRFEEREEAWEEQDREWEEWDGDGDDGAE